MTVYDCDQCGLCCNLRVEVSYSDVLREPRIATEGQLVPGRESLPILGQRWRLNGQGDAGFRCAFAANSGQCGIYNTRPNVCVLFPAGSERCQELRKIAGLDALAPREAVTTVDKIKAAELAIP